VYAVHTHGMATHAPPPASKPRRCPCCGQPYAHRVPASLSKDVNLTRHYRCGQHGRHLYLHEIELHWDGLGVVGSE
jgi:hypothetical protein